MLRALWRVIVLPIAFVLAAVATLVVIISLGQERAVQALSARGPESIPIDAVVDLAALAMRLASIYTLVPALLLVIVGEVARIRSALYYVIGGGIALGDRADADARQPAHDRARAVARRVAGARHRRVRGRLRLLAAGWPQRLSRASESRYCLGLRNSPLRAKAPPLYIRFAIDGPREGDR